MIEFYVFLNHLLPLDVDDDGRQKGAGRKFVKRDVVANLKQEKSVRT